MELCPSRPIVGSVNPTQGAIETIGLFDVTFNLMARRAPVDNQG